MDSRTLEAKFIGLSASKTGDQYTISANLSVTPGVDPVSIIFTLNDGTGKMLGAYMKTLPLDSSGVDGVDGTITSSAADAKIIKMFVVDGNSLSPMADVKMFLLPVSAITITKPATPMSSALTVKQYF